MTTKKAVSKKKKVSNEQSKSSLYEFEDILESIGAKHIIKNGNKFYKSIVFVPSSYTEIFESTQDMIERIDKEWDCPGLGKLISENLNQLSTRLALCPVGFKGNRSLISDFYDMMLDYLRNNNNDDDYDNEVEKHIVTKDDIIKVFDKLKQDTINSLEQMEKSIDNFMHQIPTDEVAFFIDEENDIPVISSIKELEIDNKYDEYYINIFNKINKSDEIFTTSSMKEELAELARLKRKYELV